MTVVATLYVVALSGWIGWLAHYHRLLTADPALNDRVMGAGYTRRQIARIERDVALAAWYGVVVVGGITLLNWLLS